MQSPVGTSRVEQSAEAARPDGKRSAAGRGASVSSIPVGNHGDNLPMHVPSGVAELLAACLEFRDLVWGVTTYPVTPEPVRESLLRAVKKFEDDLSMPHGERRL